MSLRRAPRAGRLRPEGCRYFSTSPTPCALRLAERIPDAESAPPVSLPLCDTGDEPAARGALRRTLRQRREALSRTQRRRASGCLARRLARLPALRRARHVALYLPVGGEIDPTPLIDWLHDRGARVYLPVLRPLVENRLWFVRLRKDTQLVLNRFRIAEPALRQSAERHRRIAPWALDAVLMPLVGFDRLGHRMGMGGGFYDRTFAFIRQPEGPRPLLIGVAHACQEVSALPHQRWDVDLDAVVTDRATIFPTGQ